MRITSPKFAMPELYHFASGNLALAEQQLKDMKEAMKQGKKVHVECFLSAAQGNIEYSHKCIDEIARRLRKTGVKI